MNAVPDIAFACVLGLAALLAALIAPRARAAARDYLLFAAALYGALAVADLLCAVHVVATSFAISVTLAIAALGPCALLFALAASYGHNPRGWIVAPALALAAIAGIFAAATGAVFVAFAPLFACLCAILVLALRHFRMQGLPAILAALALLAGAAAFMIGDEGRTGFALFSAAGLMGLTLACASGAHVEHKRTRRPRALAVRPR